MMAMLPIVVIVLTLLVVWGRSAAGVARGRLLPTHSFAFHSFHPIFVRSWSWVGLISGALRAVPRGRRAGFALRDLLATICCLSLAGMLGCMWINEARTPSRRNGCLSNIRQLALAIECHEAATGRFPTVSDAAAPLSDVAPGTLGSDATNSAGYSWLVQILPYLEEQILYDEISESSDDFAARPFDPTVAGSDGAHFSTRQLVCYRCPSYSGGATVQSGAGSEYDDQVLIGGQPAAANYVAIVGTHAGEDGRIVENGVIVSRCQGDSAECDNNGLSMGDVSDGISKTVIVCETIEPVYAAWFDGQAGWVVGLDPQNAGAIGGDGFATAAATMLGKRNYSMLALPKGWPGRLVRRWGPSSEHSGGVVLHAFADAHAQAISPDIDPSLYYRLITRHGAEPMDIDEL